LLTLQLVGCLLWVLLSRGDDGATADDDESSDTAADVCSRKDQGGWSVMAAAEEGRGVYQKLLSHA
jgi:hypothetical protein